MALDCVCILELPGEFKKYSELYMFGVFSITALRYQHCRSHVRVLCTSETKDVVLRFWGSDTVPRH